MLALDSKLNIDHGGAAFMNSASAFAMRWRWGSLKLAEKTSQKTACML